MFRGFRGLRGLGILKALIQSLLTAAKGIQGFKQNSFGGAGGL